MKNLTSALLLAGVSVAASAETGTVYARSTPPGASVYLDGSQAPSGTTPTVLRGLSAGEHSLRFVFPDGRELVRRVTVQANKLASIAVSLSGAGSPEAPKAPGAGAVLNVISDPLGAEISVDGKVVGKTPYSARGLTPGAHRLTLKKEGFRKYETSIELKPGETRQFQARLTPSSSSPRPSTKKVGVPKRAQKDCLMCKGKGHIEKMGCPVCKRTCYARDVTRCANCAGTGTVDAGCLRCGGTGVVRGEACRACGGSGKPRCAMCKGKGKIEADNPDYYKDKFDIQTCPYCTGSGLNESFKCRVCAGSGTRKASTARDGLIWLYTLKCWFCDGKGKALPPCEACRKTGFLGGKQQAVPCPKCGGTGKLLAPCQGCRGRGWIKRPKR